VPVVHDSATDTARLYILSAVTRPLLGRSLVVTQVETVRYPGLASFPQKELADRQHANGVHGGMLWFEVAGGTEVTHLPLLLDS
jgi:cystathionine beta-lyase/cystathionine gamma-synthase